MNQRVIYERISRAKRCSNNGIMNGILRSYTFLRGRQGQIQGQWKEDYNLGDSGIESEDIFWFDFDKTFIQIDAGHSLRFNEQNHKNALINNVEWIHQIMNACRAIYPNIRFGILSRRTADSIYIFIERYNQSQTEEIKKIYLDHIIGSGSVPYLVLGQNKVKAEIYEKMGIDGIELEYIKQRKQSSAVIWSILKGHILLSCKSGILLDDTIENIEIYRNGGIMQTRNHMGIHLSNGKELRTFSEDLLAVIQNPAVGNVANNGQNGQNTQNNKNRMKLFRVLKRLELENAVAVAAPAEVASYSVMTYNILWEAITKNRYIERCRNEDCVRSIAAIIVDNAKQYHLDFIFLQEIKITDDNQWGNLKNRIEETEPQFFHHYGITGKDSPNADPYNEPFLAGNIILYNQHKFEILKDENGKDLLYCINIGQNQTDHRPVVFALFENKMTKERVLCVNVHFPHGNMQHAYQRIKQIIEHFRGYPKNDQARIIIGGDFNHLIKIDEIRQILHNDRLIDYRPKDIRTCCSRKNGNIQRNKLTYWFDHIFCSGSGSGSGSSSDSDVKIQYILPNILKYNRISSDHIPIIALIH